MKNKLKNKLKDQTSPYLLQHAENPVNWYPWGNEAFELAEKEDKPIFLSIGYSTCHWCHVMAHESFEDEEVAKLLNDRFISIKVDKEERPDIDSIYMSVCQTFTGSGGWPMSVFITPQQKPFFAGTYFAKESSHGRIGLMDLLKTISRKWEKNREELQQSAESVLSHLSTKMEEIEGVEPALTDRAVLLFRQIFDETDGGFGSAPKFPTPHHLLFLLRYHEMTGESDAQTMAERTLLQMYRGGLFDHIGFGFSRYSTDKHFLAPHFEKMLYDNALLMMSYAEAFDVTKKPLYKKVAEQTADYIRRELTDENGGFYCAQDADSEGVEGKYYVFDYDEILRELGSEKGQAFNAYYGITKAGNFEGKNIPNLLSNEKMDGQVDDCLPLLYQYRKNRATLHLDDKQLTSWNSLMIAAFAVMYQVFGEDKYLQAAEKANQFIQKHLYQDGTLFVSYRKGSRSGKGFLDDYAFYGFALLALYEATLDRTYLEQAITVCRKAIADFSDEAQGGFYLYGTENEQLILKPKETYDGAIPSGNSVMAYNLMKLARYTKESAWKNAAERQLAFMCMAAKEYPAGYSFFLMALLIARQPEQDIVCVLKDPADLQKLRKSLRDGAHVTVLTQPEEQYKWINDKTTFYVCKNQSCLPPVNELSDV